MGGLHGISQEELTESRDGGLLLREMKEVAEKVSVNGEEKKWTAKWPYEEDTHVNAGGISAPL